MATTDQTEVRTIPAQEVSAGDPFAEGQTGAEELGRPGALSAFRSRPFLLFWSTITLSLTGVWVRITAQGWLVYDLTDDEFLLGLVSFCQATPVLVAFPIAGGILDRVDLNSIKVPGNERLRETLPGLGIAYVSTTLPFAI